jgi:hypothetical protein
MKIRRRDTGMAEGLPPPPAPTARDANPWTISSHEARHPADPVTRPQAGAGDRGAATSRWSPRATSARPASTRGMERIAAGSRPRRPSLIALLVPLAIAFAAVLGFVRAFESGDYRAAIGPLMAAAFAAFVLTRLMRRRS